MMPGLLFHHETPAKDWFYDDLTAWEHYVPVDLTLDDLHDKFLWAEAHPDEARRIARAGQDFVRNMRTDEWMRDTYDRYFVRRLGDTCRRSISNNTCLI